MVAIHPEDTIGKNIGQVALPAEPHSRDIDSEQTIYSCPASVRKSGCRP